MLNLNFTFKHQLRRGAQHNHPVARAPHPLNGHTVPINSSVLDWRSAAPPAAWKALIARWERLDTVRTWAAVLALALFLAGTI